MRARERLGRGVLAAMVMAAPLAAAQTLDRRQGTRTEDALRQEGDAILALADAAAGDQPVPSDFSLAWHNDFLKAQPGTFIPFIVRVVAPALQKRAALLYVRASRRPAAAPDATTGPPRRPTDPPGPVFHAFEEIYPIELDAEPGHAVRIARGFSLTPGEYDLTVVVRERDADDEPRRRRLAGVLRRSLSVPDFSGPELATSTVILADRLTVLADPPPATQLRERPYVIGTRELHPAADAEFGRDEELIVVFLVYNLSVREDKHFDLEVEYHFSRTAGVGEAYFNRTEPQRFNRDVLGPDFDPAAGQPVMAGQGVPLAGFPEGEYKLTIRVRDLVSGRVLERQVTFTVRSRRSRGRSSGSMLQRRKPWNA
jgi:hypothetical protein